MNQIIEPSREIVLPSPGVPVSMRVARMEDAPAIDALQKQYNKQLGFFPRAQMEGYIQSGWMIVAEEKGSGVRDQGSAKCELNSALSPDPCPLTPRVVGYCASRDRYLKRDELGAIFQLCVAPGSQRKFVGMAMLKHVFEHAPYGCKLYCCWCAQDLPANYFWESMGFVPLAFRAGSAAKARVHIFWQKRIRSGDETTPYWFPANTTGGSIREDRIVLPIPPGKNWWDEMPRVLPRENPKLETRNPKQIPNPKSKNKASVSVGAPKQSLGGWSFNPPAPAKPSASPRDKAPRVKRTVKKNDPKFVAAARELRDRWLEHANANPQMLLPQGKYQVSRTSVSSDFDELSSSLSRSTALTAGLRAEGSRVVEPALPGQASPMQISPPSMLVLPAA